MSEDLQFGRAKNAVRNLFEERLIVPKIYFDAEWAHHHVDVLAVDRAGVGDVHAVLLLAKPYRESGESAEYPELLLQKWIEKFATIPAHHKYIGVVETRSSGREERFSPPFLESAFAPDGIGRIGFLSIHVPTHGAPEAHIVVKPERFRAAITKIADAYVEEHTADWEIRA